MWRVVEEGESIVVAVHSSLDSVDILFNNGCMLIFGCGVQTDTHGGKLPANGFKFTIHDCSLWNETVLTVYVTYVFYAFYEGFCLIVLNHLGCSKLDAMGYCDKMAILLMNMMSADIATCVCLIIMSMGIATTWVVTLLGVLQVVFLFRAPTSSPKMCLAAWMLFQLIGHPGRMPSSMYQIKSFVLGQPMVHCIWCASVACEYSSFVAGSVGCHHMD